MKLSDDDIKMKIKSFFIETFLMNNTAFVIEDNDSFLEKGIVDSTGVLEVINFLQENFKIEIKDEEILPENLDSLNNMARFIQTKIGSEGTK